MLTSLIKCSIAFPFFGKTILTPRTNSEQRGNNMTWTFSSRDNADCSQEGVRSHQLCGRQPPKPSITPPAGGYLTKTRASPIKPLPFLAYWSWWGKGLSVSCFLGDDIEFLLPDEPRTMTACCSTGHALRHRGHKPGGGQRALSLFSALVVFQLSFHT